MSEQNDQANPGDRFKLMEKIHQNYFPLFLSLCKENNFIPAIQQMIDDFVIGRIGAQKGVRPFIFQLLFMLAGGKENVDYLLAAIELHLASMYCFNVAADTKTGYSTAEKKVIAYQTQNEIFDLSLRAIDKFTDDKNLADKIKKIFMKTQGQFQNGEVLDTIVNLYKNKRKFPREIIKEIENISEKEVFNNYGLPKEIIISIISELPNKPIADYTLARTYGINAAMIENFGLIIGEILNLDKEKILKLNNYGKFYGIGMMIVNDVQDYSLDLFKGDGLFATREKFKTDVFNDIKKGKITWPIKFALEIDKSLDNLFSSKLGNENILYSECDKIRLLLIGNGAIKRSVLEATFYEKLANDCIKDFEDNDTKQILFQATTTMLRLSKYIYVLEDKYKTILKPTKAEITERMNRGNIYT